MRTTDPVRLGVWRCLASATGQKLFHTMCFARLSGFLEALLHHRVSVSLAALLWTSLASSVSGAAQSDPWVSPSALALSPDGETGYVASATSGEVLCVDLPAGREIHRLHLGGEVSGLALSEDGRLLIATSAAPQSRFSVIDVEAKAVAWSIPLGHTALAPVLDSSGTTAFVCNRFNNQVSVVDLRLQKETSRISVEREPVAAALTRDGNHLLVANHLPVGRADVDVGVLSAHVSVIDVAAAALVRQIVLPNGANLLRSVQISPDGRYACVTHVLARFQLPTTQVERGWMNANALSLIDISDWSVFGTVLLDNPEQGCANPWDAEWSSDGRFLVVAHAGTHELSVIDFPKLLAKLHSLPLRTGVKSGMPGYVVAQERGDVAYDLGFLRELRTLIPLRGNGPRAVAVRNNRVWVGNYFSESLEGIELCRLSRGPVEVRLHPSRPAGEERNGEALFNDARICLQAWQSCASCHSSDARVDGLNWDLINDGVGNPKNTKSLLYAHQTPPAMSMGVRATAEVAVRAGVRHILFTAQPDRIPAAIDQWVKGLEALPSPLLVDGNLSPSAERGRAVFQSAETACASCHNTDLFTDRRVHDVGTASETDEEGDRFDTPVLMELWRTGPYLHDGSAATLREVLVEKNRGDRHGRTSHLTESQIRDLVEYLQSL